MSDSAPQHDSLAWLGNALADWDASGLRRRLIVHDGAQAAHIAVAGRSVVNFGANDYLGLAADPRVRAAAVAAIERAGWGAGASPLVTGHESAHALLERRLAEFLGTEAALVFSSGFAANAGTIACLVDERDVIFSDAKNHASLIDGCRVSRARTIVYPHNDVAALADAVASEGNAARRRLIVTDTVFSMDGDVGPLVELCDVAESTGAMLLIDEAHATGVFGPHGTGIAEHCGVAARVPIRVGTLSKALGGAGGFVAGSRTLIDWLTNRARPYVFSTAHPPAFAAAALAALDIVRDEPERRVKLLERAATLRDTLRTQGWRLGNAATQIIPLIVGDARRTMTLHRSLLERGLFVPGIRPLSVPDGESLLRISLSFSHSDDDLALLVSALSEHIS